MSDLTQGTDERTCAEARAMSHDDLAALGPSGRAVTAAAIGDEALYGLPEGVGSAAQSANTHRMEILLFSVDGTETFGINVLKVREVTLTPHITRTPNVAAGVQGVICLRGNIIPVIHLGRFVGGDCEPGEHGRTLLVTEICGRTQGFLAAAVEGIVRVEWNKVKPPGAALASGESPVSALARLADGRMVSILDVEQILARAFGEPGVPDLEPLGDVADANVLFVDDSAVARRAIARVLDKLGVRHHQATNGEEAWQKLQAIASQAQSDGTHLRRRLQVILTDAEMPRMDGYLLARLVRSDRRFDGVPVVMHTALSLRAARAMGPNSDVDAYVPKFNPVGLADTLRPMLRDRFRSTALN